MTKEELSMLKIGDIVERLNDSHGKLAVGKSSKIIGFKLNHDNTINRVRLEIDPIYGHDPKNLKIISRAKEIIDTYDIY